MAKAHLQPVISYLRRVLQPVDANRVPDAQLLERFVSHREEAAFELLVWRHERMVLGICQRLLRDREDIEDAFQATFLILVRKAGSIGKRESVASWLYKVAFRCALRAKAKALRRTGREKHGLDLSTAPTRSEPTADVIWRDLRPVLDQEISSLPEKYRQPVVLCYLEGRSYREAAAELGCSPGTISTRLTRARELLRKGLARHGLAFSGSVLFMALCAHAASAAVPAALVDATVRAALLFATGEVVGTISHAAILAQGVLKTMFMNKVRIAALFLVTVCAAGTAGLLIHGVQADPQSATSQAKTPPAQVQTPQSQAREEGKPKGDGDRDQQFPWPFRLKLQKEPITVEGRVLSPDGKALKGAEIAVIAHLDDMYTRKVPTQVLCTATSGERGEFRISVKPPQTHLCHGMMLMARYRDYAVGVKILDLVPRQQDGTVRLRAGGSVQGRVVAPDGRPVPNVRVAIRTWRVDLNEAYFDHSTGRAPAAWPSSEPTDKNGRFKFTNIPRTQKTLEFDVDDARYAPDQFTINPAPDESKEITLQLSESRLVEGTVVCGDTGKPLPNAWLLVALCDRGGTGDLQMGAIQAKTNAEGKFQARCKPGKFLTIYVYPPFGTPYPSWVEESQPWPEGAVRKEVRISIRRGILVRGKVIDSDSGMGIADAGVEYTVPQIQENNPYFKPDTILQIYWGAEYRRALTREDGSFELAVMPGPGALNVRAPTLDFVRLPLEKGEGFVQVEGQLKIDPKPETKSLSVTIPLRRGITIKGQLVGPKGENIDSAFALYPHSARLNFWQSQAEPLLVRNGHFELPGCEPKKVTRVYFVDSAHGWGASADIDPQKADKEPPRIVLHPCGSVSVRFVDSQNRPWVGHGTWARKPKPLPFMYPLLMIEEPPEGERDITHYIGWYAHTFDSARYRDLLTDADGRVTFPTLIPGAPYKLLVFDMPAGVVAKKDFTVEAGQNLKLPDVTVERPRTR